MTVLVNKTRVSFFGDGVAKTFIFDFKMLKGSRIRTWVSIDGAGYTETTLDTIVKLNINQELNPGGIVTYPVIGSPLTVNDTIIIDRNGLFNQLTDYTNPVAFDNASIENQLDLAAMERQELKSALGYIREDPLAPIEFNEAAGYQNVIKFRRPKYEVVTDTVLRINGGRFYDGLPATPLIYIIPTYIDYDFGSSLDANTWYYLYIDKSQVVGSELDANMLMHSTTIPAYTSLKEGYYTGVDLCIMAVLTDGDGHILKFFHDGGSYIQWEDQINEGTYVAVPTPNLVNLNTSVPRISSFVDLTFRLKNISGSSGGISLYTYVTSLRSDIICNANTAGETSIANSVFPCLCLYNILAIYVSSTNDNEIKVFTNGWYLSGCM